MTTWNLEQTQCHLLICNGGSCMKRGAEKVTQAINDEIARLGADKLIHTTRTRCNGRCADACVVIAYPDGVWYGDMTPKSGRKLVRKQLQGKRLKKRIIYSYKGTFIAAKQTRKGKSKKDGLLF
ncbi:(2Fe-2S) ferredoxin domain-containing protein [Paenibacillus sp. 598K]|uniref:(2Fe-2S) ferredoxin domain-containing protein n=1 Tax=Paenibacillus sp. 598K TaxID=1117987 RepID=UPI000FFF5114|nr:(2Fe-2S) ferredoxin domain-containing protein [Paenibacillus sp. 598K]